MHYRFSELKWNLGFPVLFLMLFVTLSPTKADNLITIDPNTTSAVSLASGASNTINLGDVHTLSVTPISSTPIWVSDRPNIVSVNANGQLIALAPGNATITATIPQPNGGPVIPAITVSVIITVPTQSLTLTGPANQIHQGDLIHIGQPNDTNSFTLTRNGIQLTPKEYKQVQWNAGPSNLSFDIVRDNPSTVNDNVIATTIGSCTITASLPVGKAASPLTSNGLPIAVQNNQLEIVVNSPIFSGDTVKADVRLNGATLSAGDLNNLLWHLSTNSDMPTSTPIQFFAPVVDELTIFATYTKNSVQIAASRNFIVSRRANSIEIEVTPNLTEGTTVAVDAIVRDINLATIKKTVVWDTNLHEVAQFNQNTNLLNIAKSGTLAIIASVDNVTVTKQVTIMPKPQIKTVKALLIPIQPPTVKQNFGDEINRDYYCYEVTLNNVLGTNDDPSFNNKAILAFSDSIITHVNLVKRYVGKGPDPTGASQGWSVVTNSDFANYGVRPDPTITDDPLSKGNEPSKPNDPHVFLWQPYRQELLTGGEEARNANSSRNRLFNAVQIFATLLSFTTSTNLLRGSAPNVLDKFTNLLVPGIENRIPDLQPTQRQNLLNDIMQPVETIGFNRPLTKTVFFPKGSLPGYLVNYETRISTVIRSYFSVNVAVVEEVNNSGNVAK